MKSEKTIAMIHADLCGYLLHANLDEKARKGMTHYIAALEWVLEINRPSHANPMEEVAGIFRHAKNRIAERN